ncbi:MAG: sodium:alanine symporter family protein [Clostridia bacterium]|nr:sodium:alanine symporter family protein [Clostridia bacterium]
MVVLWLEWVNDRVWSGTLLTLIFAVGAYITARTRCIQLRRFGQALRLVRRGEGEGGISAFSAVCTALSAAIGTGNIIGVATAVVAGGPGALFWMVLSAVLGMAIKYAEGVLAVRYRVRDTAGFSGGPYYYIERGMGYRWRWLGKLFALFGALAGLLGMGTVIQSNSIAAAVSAMTESGGTVTFMLGDREYSLTTVLVGGAVTVLAALVILGGIQRIAKVAAVLVPFMLGLYTLAIVTILVTFAAEIPSALWLILRAAFAPRAALGAAAGVTVKQAIRMGVGRGIFSNEAGMGTEAIAAAAARTSSPSRQGLVCMISTFVDTVVLCTLAGVVLVVTDAYRQPGLDGIAMTAYAWQQGLPLASSVASTLLMLCLVFFAFSTILGWNFYAQECMRYLCGGRREWMKLYRFLYIAAVGIGPYLSSGAAWVLADIFNGCMIFPNLVALLSLCGIVVRETAADAEKMPKNRTNSCISRKIT